MRARTTTATNGKAEGHVADDDRSEIERPAEIGRPAGAQEERHQRHAHADLGDHDRQRHGALERRLARESGSARAPAPGARRSTVLNAVEIRRDRQAVGERLDQRGIAPGLRIVVEREALPDDVAPGIVEAEQDQDGDRRIQEDEGRRQPQPQPKLAAVLQRARPLASQDLRQPLPRLELASVTPENALRRHVIGLRGAGDKPPCGASAAAARQVLGLGLPLPGGELAAHLLRLQVIGPHHQVDDGIVQQLLQRRLDASFASRPLPRLCAGLARVAGHRCRTVMLGKPQPATRQQPDCARLFRVESRFRTATMLSPPSVHGEPRRDVSSVLLNTRGAHKIPD